MSYREGACRARRVQPIEIKPGSRARTAIGSANNVIGVEPTTRSFASDPDGVLSFGNTTVLNAAAGLQIGNMPPPTGNVTAQEQGTL